jgi:hypothetical protein
MRFRRALVISLALSAALSVQSCGTSGPVEPTGTGGPTTTSLGVEPATTRLLASRRHSMTWPRDGRLPG